MYGIIVQLISLTGKRDELIEILLKGTHQMPGCISYQIAKDLKNNDAIWITEVWESKDSHAACFSIPEVKKSLEKGKPLIKGFGEKIETYPVKRV